MDIRLTAKIDYGILTPTIQYKQGEVMRNAYLCTDDRFIEVTDAQRDAINILSNVQKGGFATIHRYKPSTNVIDQPVYDVQIISRFSTQRLYERKLKALQGIMFPHVLKFCNHEKFNKLNIKELEELFNKRKQMEMDSIEKSLSHDRSDAHRQGHDRCYVQLTEGVTGHLLTEKDSQNLMQPVIKTIHNSSPVFILESIMVNAIEINRKVRVEGRYKVVNSGPAVLMGNAIKKVLNQRSVGYKRFSLKADNFSSLSIGGQAVYPNPLIEQLVA